MWILTDKDNTFSFLEDDLSPQIQECVNSKHV